MRFWEQWGVTAADGLEITLVNHHLIDRTNVGVSNPFTFIRDRFADATLLSAADLREYDLIFSNSFLEHLPEREQQVAMTRKILESGRWYFIQVPNKFSPIDPHFPRPYVPFFALYPKELQARLWSLSALGSESKADSIEAARLGLRYYNPLGWRDMRRLLPDAELRVERPLGVPMSILAFRRTQG